MGGYASAAEYTTSPYSGTKHLTFSYFPMMMLEYINLDIAKDVTNEINKVNDRVQDISDPTSAVKKTIDDNLTGPIKRGL